MAISKNEYSRMAKKASPKTPKLVTLVKAYGIGGLICAFGEALKIFYTFVGMDKKDVDLSVPVTLIVLTAVLTALGVFDRIAKHAGAGTIVPITGFANAIVSPAMEFRSEGRILGTGAEMFRIAGPVLVYGSAAAVIYGFVFWVVQR